MAPNWPLPNTVGEEQHAVVEYACRKLRLHVSVNGKFVQEQTGFRYAGGQNFLECFCTSASFADVSARLAKVAHGRVCICYQSPDEPLDPELLISISDDQSLQTMFEVYEETLIHSTSPQRLRLFLFPCTADHLLCRANSSTSNATSCTNSRFMMEAKGSLDHTSLDAHDEDVQEAFAAGFEAGLQCFRFQQQTVPRDNAATDEVMLAVDTPPKTSQGISARLTSKNLSPQLLMHHNKLSPGDSFLTFAADATAYCTQQHDDFGLPDHISVFGDDLPRDETALLYTENKNNCVQFDGSSNIIAGNPFSDLSFFNDPLPQLPTSDEVQGLPGELMWEDPRADYNGNSMRIAKPVRNGPVLAIDSRACSAAFMAVGLHKVPRSAVTVLARLGEGTFGKVTKAETEDFGVVAIKWLKASNDGHHAALWTEADMMNSLNHPHVLRFYGVVVDDFANDMVVGIITEFMNMGSLAQLLRRRATPLTLLERVDIALQVASGMMYMAKMGVVHFDLKSDNLLVHCDGNGPLVVKIADFGLSKSLKEISEVKELRGTLMWMAPELLQPEKGLTERCDVWSFGTCLWEIMTLQTPHADLPPDELVSKLSKGSLRLEYPKWCEAEWSYLIDVCTDYSPSCRPSFADVRLYLLALRNHLAKEMSGPITAQEAV